MTGAYIAVFIKSIAENCFSGISRMRIFFKFNYRRSGIYRTEVVNFLSSLFAYFLKPGRSLNAVSGEILFLKKGNWIRKNFGLAFFVKRGSKIKIVCKKSAVLLFLCINSGIRHKAAFYHCIFVGKTYDIIIRNNFKNRFDFSPYGHILGYCVSLTVPTGADVNGYKIFSVRD